MQQDLTVANLPEVVCDTLLGMPHTNQRKMTKKWYEYYDQRMLDLVHAMYKKAFAIFDYDPVLTQQPDLKAPAKHFLDKMEHMLCNSSKDSVTASASMCREYIKWSAIMPTSGSVVKPHFRLSMMEERGAVMEGRMLFDESKEVEHRV